MYPAKDYFIIVIILAVLGLALCYQGYKYSRLFGILFVIVAVIFIVPYGLSNNADPVQSKNLLTALLLLLVIVFYAMISLGSKNPTQNLILTGVVALVLILIVFWAKTSIFSIFAISAVLIIIGLVILIASDSSNVALQIISIFIILILMFCLIVPQVASPYIILLLPVVILAALPASRTSSLANAVTS